MRPAKCNRNSPRLQESFAKDCRPPRCAGTLTASGPMNSRDPRNSRSSRTAASTFSGSCLQIAGPNTEIVTVRLERAATIVGVRFQPGIAARWLGVSAAELLNAHPLLEDVWEKRATARLSDKLADARNAPEVAAILEHFLIGRLHEVAPADPIIDATAAAAAREGAHSKGIVRGLIDEFGWSERTLRRRCLDAFGYGPKTLERILRFQRFLRLAA